MSLRTSLHTLVIVVALGLSPAAQAPKSQFFTSSDGLKIHYLELVPKETHGSVHLNPAYTQTLVKFIDGHDR